ncbi:NADH dehydrogenase (ubiquinone) SGDH subunit [Dermatophagoides farinae]|uniref:NADH dehydrogenase [ubiquinone] 1 beta subcomplex subunit 5, mitochondrial n=1 Tax=Dermatophagoides farinae TaxID=6954 RepID=A0A9D4SH59_DERFA|nr:NADH dehydrogenase [ubiquinone] 1 beta subcomplex subunit 5, mitochondrial-like [Dermatophagoides farinae]KAH7642264.1 nadh dehydrogenase [Dermatophagoides farinae]
MTLLSTLKVLARNGVIRDCQKISVRFSGHGHKMHIQPSRFVWSTFKDYLHFYFMLGAIPLTLITAYANIVVGDAELTDIPEGYTPHHWEYYKHPITRFFAKYCFLDRALAYESSVSKLAEESEKILIHRVKQQLKMMMAEKADNKAWYYTEVDPAQNRWLLDKFRTIAFKTEGISDRGELDD